MTDSGVSILLPFRDAGATLAACIASIHAQTWPDFEVLCVDDGSRDDGTAMIQAAADSDPRFRYLRAPPPGGLVAALNHGLARARYELVARMDADDLMHPCRIALQRAAMRRDAAIAVLGSRVEAFPAAALSDGFRAYIAWQNGCVAPSAIAGDIYLESPLAHPSVMLRRSIVVAAGGYREGAFPEDYELWLRLHQGGQLLAKLPQTLLQWRDHPGRLSRTGAAYERVAFDRLRARLLAADPRLVAARDRLAIWGAGRRTRQRVAHLLGHGYRPIAWIDIDPDKIGNRLDGVPVVDPTWLRREPKPFVLSYVASHGARPCIEAELGRLGYRKGTDYLHVG